MGNSVVRRETRKRGFFGKVCKGAFVLFNGLMLIWLIGYWMKVSTVVPSDASDAMRAGAGIGATIGSALLISVWAMGDIILGLFVMFTRGKLIIVEEIVSA